MLILCPQCRCSVDLREGDAVLTCTQCDLRAPLSQMGTAPGVAGVPLLRDRSGMVLGGFELSEMIGFGGMGTVYRASAADSAGDRAVKILHPDSRWGQETFVARFERECQALQRLEHESVVRLEDFGEQDGLHYMIMELAPGQNLATLARERELQTGEIVDILVQVCDGISFAHDNGIVHRDLKPANIVVSDQGRVKVLDFGLAQITGADVQLSELTRTDVAMGTFNYLSPEQRLNAKTVDHRADIFALGVILYEMLTGTLPIGRYELPSRVRPRHGRTADRIVERALEPDPAKRYQSATELAQALAALKSPRRASVATMLAAGAGLAAAALVSAWTAGLFESSPAIPPPISQKAPATAPTLPPNPENLRPTSPVSEVGDASESMLRAGAGGAVVPQPATMPVLADERPRAPIGKKPPAKRKGPAKGKRPAKPRAKPTADPSNP